MGANSSRRDFLHGICMGVATLSMTGCADTVKCLALDFTFYGRSVCLTLCMCSHAQSILLFRIKESLAIYYLRSLCLCAFATRPAALPLK